MSFRLHFGSATPEADLETGSEDPVLAVVREEAAVQQNGHTARFSCTAVRAITACCFVLALGAWLAVFLASMSSTSSPDTGWLIFLVAAALVPTYAVFLSFCRKKPRAQSRGPPVSVEVRAPHRNPARSNNTCAAKDPREAKLAMFEAAFPTSTYLPSDDDVLGESETCAVCLADKLCGQECRRLQCGHCFHKECIDLWWLSSCTHEGTCPLCRKKSKLDRSLDKCKSRNTRMMTFGGSVFVVDEPT